MQGNSLTPLITRPKIPVTINLDEKESTCTISLMASGIVLFLSECQNNQGIGTAPGGLKTPTRNKLAFRFNTNNSFIVDTVGIFTFTGFFEGLQLTVLNLSMMRRHYIFVHRQCQKYPCD